MFPPDPEAALLLAHHALIADALKYGSKTEGNIRPPLPLELVRYIMRLADCKVHSPLTLFTNNKFIITSSGVLNSHIWIHTNPLSALEISKIWGMQLTTVSANQRSQQADQNIGCWSWFEIAIYTPKSEERRQPGSDATRVNRNITRTGFDIGNRVFELKYRPNGKGLSWISHRNETMGYKVHRYDGFLFGAHQSLWSQLSPGDCIVVLACCKFQGWSCKGERALLKFWEYLDPQSILID
jgi:hypothetical protein